jgi:hypothetical protein
MSNIYKIIERLCNDKDITEEEQGLVKEYLKSGDDLIKHINKYNEKWKKSGIDPRELSGDGFARDILVFEGAENFIEGRSLIVSEWEEQLAQIEARLEKLKS